MLRPPINNPMMITEVVDAIVGSWLAVPIPIPNVRLISISNKLVTRIGMAVAKLARTKVATKVLFKRSYAAVSSRNYSVS
jgi:hypothetical protein